MRGFDDSDVQLRPPARPTATLTSTLTSNTPKPVPFENSADFNSDLAFENGFAYGGNYDGVQIWDVGVGWRRRAWSSSILCPGSQNDVTVNDGILVTSTDSRRTDDTGAERGDEHSELAPTTWEGLKIFDVRNPAGAEVRQVRAHRLRLAHPHGDPRSATACSSTCQSYDVAAGPLPKCDG